MGPVLGGPAPISFSITKSPTVPVRSKAVPRWIGRDGYPKVMPLFEANVWFVRLTGRTLRFSA